jgi:hypothetical protein
MDYVSCPRSIRIDIGMRNRRDKACLEVLLTLDFGMAD